MDAEKRHEDSIEKIGRDFKEQMNMWAESYALHDFIVWKVLHEKLGREKAKDIFIDIWAELAKLSADGAMEEYDLTEKNIHTLGQIAKYGYNLIGCPYEIEKGTDEEHVGHVTECPFYRFSSEMFGDYSSSEERAMYWEDTAECTDNFHKTQVEHLGLSDEVEAGCDKQICTEDDYCRIYFRKKNK